MSNEFEYDFWNAYPDNDELLAVLTKAGCPIVCVGYRDPGGMDWHEECEKRGMKALVILRGWVIHP